MQENRKLQMLEKSEFESFRLRLFYAAFSESRSKFNKVLNII